MPGLHTDYWEKACPCCVPDEPELSYCRKCDKDRETVVETELYPGYSVKVCIECGSEIGEPQELDEIDADMEWFETARKKRN